MIEALIIISIVFAVIIGFILCIYLFVLQYPHLRKEPKSGKWYRITSPDMLSSDGSRYKAFFRKGSENKVLVYFAGGGVSISAETAKEDIYIRRVAPIDKFANNMMNSSAASLSAVMKSDSRLTDTYVTIAQLMLTSSTIMSSSTPAMSGSTIYSGDTIPARNIVTRHSADTIPPSATL